MLNKQLLLLPAVGLVAALAGVLVFQFTQPQPAVISAAHSNTPQSNTPAPTFEDWVFDDLHATPHHLKDWQAPLLVVNLWAPWCAPCRREIPALIALQAELSPQVQIIGLALDSAENVEQFAQQHDFNYPLLLAQKNTAALNRFVGNRSDGLPFTAIYDESRQQVYQHAGEITRNDLLQAIQNLQRP